MPALQRGVLKSHPSARWAMRWAGYYRIAVGRDNDNANANNNTTTTTTTTTTTATTITNNNKRNIIINSNTTNNGDNNSPTGRWQRGGQVITGLRSVRSGPVRSGDGPYYHYYHYYYQQQQQ